jgi:mannose-6-phosphate isomerase-like protein (cupin superfamily)
MCTVALKRRFRRLRFITNSAGSPASASRGPVVTDDDVVMDAHRPVDIARGDPELTFHEFVAFNNGHFAVFRASGAGAGPWEMHPDTDELLFALEGSVTVEVFDASGNELVPLQAGSLLVISRGRWHRHVDADDLVELYHTPGQSLSCEDPATASENDGR